MPQGLDQGGEAQIVPVFGVGSPRLDLDQGHRGHGLAGNAEGEVDPVASSKAPPATVTRMGSCVRGIHAGSSRGQR